MGWNTQAMVVKLQDWSSNNPMILTPTISRLGVLSSCWIEFDTVRGDAATIVCSEMNRLDGSVHTVIVKTACF